MRIAGQLGESPAGGRDHTIEPPLLRGRSGARGGEQRSGGDQVSGAPQRHLQSNSVRLGGSQLLMDSSRPVLDIDQDLLECGIVLGYKVVLVGRADGTLAQPRGRMHSERDGSLLWHSSSAWILQVGESHVARAQFGWRNHQQLVDAEIRTANLTHHFGTLVRLAEGKESQSAASARGNEWTTNAIRNSHLQLNRVAMRADIPHTQCVSQILGQVGSDLHVCCTFHSADQIRSIIIFKLEHHCSRHPWLKLLQLLIRICLSCGVF